MKCIKWLDWSHAYGWPHHGIQTCIDCGHTRPCKVQFHVRLNYPPRYSPKAQEDSREARIEREWRELQELNRMNGD